MVQEHETEQPKRSTWYLFALILCCSVLVYVVFALFRDIWLLPDERDLLDTDGLEDVDRTGISLKFTDTIELKMEDKGMNLVSINSLGPDGLENMVRCKVCYENLANMVCLPCLHQVLCPECSKKVRTSSRPNCPLCREPILRTLGVYH